MAALTSQRRPCVWRISAASPQAGGVRLENPCGFRRPVRVLPPPSVNLNQAKQGEAMTTSAIPSPPACDLYVQMSLHADPLGHLSLVDTLDLALERAESGVISDTSEVYELVTQGWIACAEDGGWTI